MTNTQKMFSLSAAAMVAGFLAIPMFTSGANASVTSRLMNCASNDKYKTIECCESVVRGATPLWMRTTGRNCTAAVVCSGGRKPTYASTTVPKRRCQIAIWSEDNPNGNDQPQRSRPQSRSPNSRR